MTKEDLVYEAIEARDLSYSPYSKFAVGAALLTKDGEIYRGANIENASFSLTMCAERNAIFNAYCHGVRSTCYCCRYGITCLAMWIMSSSFK